LPVTCSASLPTPARQARGQFADLFGQPAFAQLDCIQQLSKVRAGHLPFPPPAGMTPSRRNIRPVEARKILRSAQDAACP
jgi:hypothetical protein